MTRITGSIRRFVRNEEAATMVEYGLMLALIAVVCLVAVGLVGTNANGVFNQIATAIGAA